MAEVADSISHIADNDARFAAFISYSHADVVLAAKLQRKLERYRLPRRIAETRKGQNSRLGAIFRDREDFAVAANLTDAIRAAVIQADTLVVLCSVEAAASPWVNAEIELFRSVHPDRPVFAVLLSGEPSISFPPALVADGIEPLAADLRPVGDGAQLGFLKIVAGIAGVPLDALIQRDAQRRIRRVMAITLGAVTAMLVMGVMTTYAISARNEAARERAEAEGLVEFMLTDLREKLKGVGRLDVMSAVNSRAMTYYRQQDNLKNLPTDSQERRARLLHAMGEDEVSRGHYSNALSKFLESYKVTNALLRDDNKNPHRIFGHAQSEYWIGYSNYIMGDFSKSKPYLLRYEQLARRLRLFHGHEKLGATEVAYATNNLCALASKSDPRKSEVSRLCLRALNAQRDVLAIDPDDHAARLSLANSLAWYADTLEADGSFKRSLDCRKEQISIIDQLIASDPKNFDLIDFSLTALTASARIRAKLGEKRAALREFAELRLQASKLKDHDPENALWAKRIAQIEIDINQINKME